MIRAWRQQAGSMLIVFMGLDALAVVYGAAGASRHAGDWSMFGALMWLAVDSVLTWRTWRHRGGGARDTLLGFRMLGLLLLIRALWVRSPYLLGAWAIIAAQTVLLASPAIRDHVN